MIIREITAADREWVTQAVTNLWGSEEIVARGRLINLINLQGFIAEEEGRKVGLVTYQIIRHSQVIPDSDLGSTKIKEELDSRIDRNDNEEFLECEIASLNALTPGKGIGTALIQKVGEIAKEKNCKKLIVITTNDNVKALRFYQKKGFTISAVRVNELTKFRKLKPEIPQVGEDGIPLRDEIELEMSLSY